MRKSEAHKKTAVVVLVAILIMFVVIVSKHPAVRPVAVSPTIAVKPAVIPQQPAKPLAYHTVTVATADPAGELATAVGANNVQTVLEINRIDAADIPKGRTLVVPDSFSDMAALSPFPATLSEATDIPKLMMVSLQMQAFAIYDSGNLVRWGGVNTGKQSTPTPAQLYFANWKGKSVVSTEDDSWVLPWYVNLDNDRGISMHQYQLPGYPASHACVRMLEQDAEWIYNWVDQWKVSEDGQTVLAHGTPVLVFGTYAYGRTAPWKKLPTNPAATTLSSDALNAVISDNKGSL